MRGTNLEIWQGMAERDIVITKRFARVVIQISPDNKSFEFTENPDPRLNVLVIIGPPRGEFAQKLDQVVLAEIAFGQSRPYHRSTGLNPQPEQSDIVARKKIFCLSKEQYLLVAPFVFEYILQNAKKQAVKWQCPSHRIETDHGWWSRKKGKALNFTKWQDIYKGVAVSVSKKDKFFLADLFWAMLNLNEVIAGMVLAKTRFIGSAADFYNVPSLGYRGKIPFDELKIHRDILEDTDWLFPFLKEQVAKELPRKYKGRDILFYPDILELLGWAGTERTKEQRLAKKAKLLGDPQERLGGIKQVSLSRKIYFNQKRTRPVALLDHYAFEIVPFPSQEEFNAYKKQGMKETRTAVTFDDKIPF